MKNRKKIILILLILGLFFIALTTVNAEDNSTATLNQPNINNVEIYEDDSSTDIDESNQNRTNIVKNDYNSENTVFKIKPENKVGDNIFIGPRYSSIELTITVNNTNDFNKTGNITVKNWKYNCKYSCNR